MTLKHVASGVRHTWALLPPLPHTGCVTSGGYFTSLGLSLPSCPDQEQLQPRHKMSGG